MLMTLKYVPIVAENSRYSLLITENMDPFYFQDRPLSARERRRLRQSVEIASQPGTFYLFLTEA